ncbi:MAG: hypothetical protein K6B41_06950 [Butyrivibrio sp.]|nr:hypothetical protein [Butyrivibrio sp.]
MLIDNNSADRLTNTIKDDVFRIYDLMEGMQVLGVIVPAFLNDFDKVLNNSLIGLEVKEEYKTEDEKIHAVFTGTHLKNGDKFENHIKMVMFNDTKYYL